ncbi:MAG: response regulator transcription factor [Rhodoferax sp.]|nr:response regulator transcription factor [Pseudorhodobacter sp.]
MRILLVDDQELVRDTIAAFLRQEEGLEVSVASDFPSSVEVVRKSGPFDLVLLDYMMPGMNGLAGLSAMKKLQGTKPVAIISGTAPRSVAEQALAEGAAGFLPKTMSTRSLLAAVRFMAAGEVYAPISMMTERDHQQTTVAGAQLTPRELDVLKRLCRGLANKEIARELDLQEVTVKLHIKTLYRKIEAKNRTHAAMIAKEAGIF